ncbi:MutS-related protein [Varunaivibrio sulfuroxidans]|uniref:MutS-like protein n=1 Tax=Varunaivibrio sulfuroxidans TaxID=1773489 RepID=A0A4R3JD47_9PROT|nr:DNA mismatch repair protein MutS [Varunaivibrio sulfuroxidans]TCS63073.1 MutS-like protein [Varunaivibrio sulfuroxidans]WES31855.1 DNA mismatch repair protein MutS [Varunaivibrio sulfuroxidans]
MPVPPVDPASDSCVDAPGACGGVSAPGAPLAPGVAVLRDVSAVHEQPHDNVREETAVPLDEDNRFHEHRAWDEDMAFESILWPPARRGESPRAADRGDIPAYFRDMNLDQIVSAVVAGKESYELSSFFYRPLHDIAAIDYRHRIFRDLENPPLFAIVEEFARSMHISREYIAQVDGFYSVYQKALRFLDGIAAYCDALETLERRLRASNLGSRGFRALRAYLAKHIGSGRHAALAAEVGKLKTELAGVTYCLLIKPGKIVVDTCVGENDYGARVARTFAKFEQGAVKSHLFDFPDDIRMNHIEESVLSMVAKLYPEIFAHLDAFVEGNKTFVDPLIGAFDREVQFYMSYIEHMARLRRSGLDFCYPKMSRTDKAVFNKDGFDLALAHKRTNEGSPVVCNDFAFEGAERIAVVSGPNQGGKTTFARTFGQVHYLASLGCPVPGSSARLFLFDALFTHFERQENITDLRGKLEGDLVRIRDILRKATPDSIIVLNEIFNSTTLRDQIYLGGKVLEKIVDLDALCVCVTFIEEFATLGEKTFSMVSTVAPQNPAERTLKVVRRPADGLAHAMAIAKKHGVSYAQLKERFKP